eukprot:935827-Rhodomonas_salina.1
MACISELTHGPSLASERVISELKTLCISSRSSQNVYLQHSIRRLVLAMCRRWCVVEIAET